MQISRVFSKFSQNCPSPAGTCNYLDDVTRDDLHDDFQRNTTFQRCCDIVSNVCTIVPTFFYAVLRKKSSLRIVQCNITLKGKSYVCLDICGGIAGLHRKDIGRECNSLKNFALYVMKK